MSRIPLGIVIVVLVAVATAAGISLATGSSPNDNQDGGVTAARTSGPTPVCVAFDPANPPPIPSPPEPFKEGTEVCWDSEMPDITPPPQTIVVRGAYITLPPGSTGGPISALAGPCSFEPGLIMIVSFNESTVRFGLDGKLLASAVAPQEYTALAPLLDAIDRSVMVGDQAVTLPPTVNYGLEVPPGQSCREPSKTFDVERTVSTARSYVVYTGDGRLIDKNISPGEESLFAELVDALAKD